MLSLSTYTLRKYKATSYISIQQSHHPFYRYAASVLWCYRFSRNKVERIKEIQILMNLCCCCCLVAIWVGHLY